MGSQHAPERIPRIEAQPDRLTLHWPAGHRSRHLYYWLRENCHCPKCIHQDAWERIVDFMAIPLDLQPKSVSADAQGLHLLWPEHDAPCDGTRYSWDWLDRHRTEPDARLARKPQRKAWAGSELTKQKLSIAFAAVMRGDQGLRQLLENVDATGVGFVTGVPSEALAVIGIAERIAFVEESHFGRYFDVVSKANPVNLAYTPDALRPHNDLASRRHLPGIQFLHCLRNDVRGGDTVVVDGIAAANRLWRDDPAAFDTLSTFKTTFSSVSGDWQIANCNTVIDVDEDGDVVGTRLHPALLGPVDVEPDLQPAFYRAHRALLGVALDAAMQFTFRLDEGDCVLFDNARIIHARSAFDVGTGYRHLQGCYVYRDDFGSRLNVLRREAAEFRET